MEQTTNNMLATAAKVWLHVTATLVIAAGLALVVADLGFAELFFVSMLKGGFEPDWSALAVHLGLSGLMWGVVVVLYRLGSRRAKKHVKLEAARGAVMLETLIALVPTLLLISGIGQMAMVNVAGIVSDLAVYQASRTAWLWQPEADAGRNGVTNDDVEFRARTAAAMALAPTASSDFHVGRTNQQGSGPPFRRIRTVVAASFNTIPVTGENYWNMTGQNWSFFGNVSVQASDENLNFWRALDSDTFDMRAGRKVTSAWMCIDDFEIIRDGDQIGARFTYQYVALFPWFAYIWGDSATIAQRDGNYLPIHREMTLDVQPGM